MRDIYAPEDWYELDVDIEHRCYGCEGKDKELYDLSLEMTSVMEILYGKERLDLAKLEDHLHEICCLLDIKLPTEMPNIERKRSEIFNFAAELCHAQNM